MKGCIGSLDWDDCNTCLHSDEDEGGCDVPDVTWEASISIDCENVMCGCYKEITND